MLLQTPSVNLLISTICTYTFKVTFNTTVLVYIKKKISTVLQKLLKIKCTLTCAFRCKYRLLKQQHPCGQRKWTAGFVCGKHCYRTGLGSFQLCSFPSMSIYFYTMLSRSIGILAVTCLHLLEPIITIFHQAVKTT